MKVQLSNQDRSVGIVQLQGGDVLTRFSSIDLAKLKEAVKMMAAFSGKEWEVAILHYPDNSLRGMLTFIPKDSPGKPSEIGIAIASLIDGEGEIVQDHPDQVKLGQYAKPDEDIEKLTLSAKIQTPGKPGHKKGVTPDEQ